MQFQMILYENTIIKFAYQVLCAVKAELNVFSLYQGQAWAWTLRGQRRPGIGCSSSQLRIVATLSVQFRHVHCFNCYGVLCNVKGYFYQKYKSSQLNCSLDRHDMTGINQNLHRYVSLLWVLSFICLSV